MRSSRQALDRMVEGLDPQHGEALIGFEAGLGHDLVPILGDAGIVELEDEAGIDDRLVFLAHRIGAGEEEIVVGLVVEIAEPRDAARRDRGHEPFLDAVGLERGLEARDIRLDRRPGRCK